MVEEEKKPEETKAEEGKPEESKKEEEGKPVEKPEEETKEGNETNAEAAAPPAPPPEILLKVFMHCEGCARKVRRSLKGFPGVEDVITDCKSHSVVVKGEKADPLKVLERVKSKSHRQVVELLSPIPNPPKEEKPPEEEKPNPEEKKEEPQIVTVVLKIHMHCEACAQEMKKNIQKMKGVESAEPDLKNSEVTVKGVYDPAMLVEFVYKRCGKHAVIVKQEVEEKKEKAEEAAKEEKKGEELGEKEKEKEKEKESEGEGKKEEKGGAEGEGEAKPQEEAVAVTEETKGEEVKISEYYYNPPRNDMELYASPAYPAYYQTYPPQIFSDENPNACSVM